MHWLAPHMDFKTQSNVHTKGQLISKGLFVILNSSKKRTKKIRLNYCDTSGRTVFVRILEELKAPKRHFEIK